MDGMTITEFILARVAEDEEAAREQLRSEAAWEQETRGLVGAVVATPICMRPERVLAECEAKRRIVELHDGSHECSTYDHTGDIDNCTWCLNTEDCSTMRLLAAIWADHDDYREEWR